MIVGGWILTIRDHLNNSTNPSGEQGYAALRHEPFPFERRLMMNPLDSNGTIQSNFVKKPSKVDDDAWTELLKYSNLRFTATELDSIDTARKNSAVQLPDGGYFGNVSVYHDLHCIKSIYRFLYTSHYYPTSTPEQIELRQLHIIHCLDMLRADIMCWGDLTPFTMQWSNSHRKPSANFSSPRQCVNWDAFSYC
ncbi:hypothetical protein CONLIGDRAFT_682026 [Coniochaeta ligniaria NRRL 30616]|uniref:Tat pathway signal sequence n=1 Tax=Coniochaeta ligniaria NRRL 30616 TaxID=1408157 RepID=A0A1J7IP11_9PEZI|nr:hypothetical protein CONLIGDRAFT_682026 [Coniochaeta ligniaria NRRL 30616]